MEETFETTTVVISVDGDPDGIAYLAFTRQVVDGEKVCCCGSRQPADQCDENSPYCG
jgi:hypothetical protein